MLAARELRGLSVEQLLDAHRLRGLVHSLLDLVVGWTVGCVALCFAAALGRVLYVIPSVGPLLGMLPIAYGLLVTGHVWGRGIGRAREYGGSQ